MTKDAYYLRRLTASVAEFRGVTVPYTVTWYDDEKTILLFDISGTVSWDEFAVATDQACEMIDSVPHRVDIIFDDHIGIPNGNPFPQLRKSIEAFNQRKNLILSITVAHSRMTSLVESLVDITKRFSPMKAKEAYFVGTLAQALKIIAQDRVENQVTSD